MYCLKHYLCTSCENDPFKHTLVVMNGYSVSSVVPAVWSGRNIETE